jgi:hypothetical protein
VHISVWCSKCPLTTPQRWRVGGSIGTVAFCSRILSASVLSFNLQFHWTRINSIAIGLMRFRDFALPFTYIAFMTNCARPAPDQKDQNIPRMLTSRSRSAFPGGRIVSKSGKSDASSTSAEKRAVRFAVREGERF